MPEARAALGNHADGRAAALGLLLCGLGSAIFIAFPFVAGLTVGVLVNNIKHIALCGLSVCLLALSILVVMGLEGMLCALMAAPLAAAVMIVAGLLV